MNAPIYHALLDGNVDMIGHLDAPHVLGHLLSNDGISLDSAQRGFRVAEAGLLSIASRFSDLVVRINKTVVSVSFEQKLYDAAGDSSGNVRLTMLGTKRFGGWVTFDRRVPLVVEGRFLSSEMAHFAGFADDYVAALAEQCACGEFRDECPKCRAKRRKPVAFGEVAAGSASNVVHLSLERQSHV